MCGISGIVVPPGASIDRQILARMNNTMFRRGPDDEGYYFDDAGGCGLGHRRLSIIDVSGGHQPLESAGGLIQVIVNGELYNFMSVRAELEKLGFQFKTKSDSEVVAHGWNAWGPGILDTFVCANVLVLAAGAAIWQDSRSSREWGVAGVFPAGRGIDRKRSLQRRPSALNSAL